MDWIQYRRKEVKEPDSQEPSLAIDRKGTVIRQMCQRAEPIEVFARSSICEVWFPPSEKVGGRQEKDAVGSVRDSLPLTTALPVHHVTVKGIHGYHVESRRSVVRKEMGSHLLSLEASPRLKSGKPL